jgi:DNA polymerase
VSRDPVRDRIRAQLAGHLERLRRDGVWGLPVPEPPARQPVYAAVPDGPADAPPRDEGTGRSGSPSRSAAQGPLPAAQDNDLKDVEAEALACVACRLHEQRTKVVFGVGDPDARLMFIGEGPGRDEDLQGEPFVGRAGQLLTRIIEAMGYQREDVYIANAVKCRPPKNRDPQADEIDACRHFLMRQVQLIGPEIIVLLGRSAVNAVLDLQAPLSRLRGGFRHWGGAKVMCTYHPAYLLRNPSAKAMVWEDMKLVRDTLAGATPE